MKCTIGPIESVKDIVGAFRSAGFVVFDEGGTPCLTFSYRSAADAAFGKKALQAVLDGATEVVRSK